jgi:hypothetical protein
MMQLHRSRDTVLWGVIFLLGAPILLWASQNGWELRILFFPVGSGALFVFGVLCLIAGVLSLLSRLMPFEFAIDESGLRLRRVAGINRSLPWAAVDAVILEPPATPKGKPVLVLVPAEGADLGRRADYANKLDGRPSVSLISLDSLRESQDDIARALSTYGGPRFTDMVGESLGKI